MTGPDLEAAAADSLPSLMGRKPRPFEGTAKPCVWFILLTFWTPINLFQTVKGGYGSSVIGAAFKTLIVWFVSVVAFANRLGGLMYFTLSQI